MRRSAAVLLTRQVAGILEVYLAERSPKLRFFGGYWAFPGGVVDPVDRLAQDADGAPELERCALRELFEETGILCGGLAEAIAVGKRQALRASLVDLSTDASDWLEYIAPTDAARGVLRHVTTISTPVFSALRHSTPFFQVELPAEQEPKIIPGELLQGRFWDPSVLIREWRAGNISVAPPVLFLLELLEAVDLETFIERAKHLGEEMQAGQLHRAYFTPGVMIAPLSTPTLPPATTTNCVLIGEQRVYIVDPATPDAVDQARLFETLDRWQADGRVLRGILMTHHHADHVGAVQVTARRYGLEVSAHSETLARVELGSVPTRPILDGHSFDLGTAPDGSTGWTLEAHHTPGHAPGHLVFIESRYRAAIVGDLVSTLSTIVIDPPEGHMATYIHSLEAILAREIKVLIPAHGPGARVGSDVLRYHLQRRREREAKLLSALNSSAATLEQLLPRVYDDAPAELLPYAARSLFAGLLKLAEEGRAIQQQTGWTLC